MKLKVIVLSFVFGFLPSLAIAQSNNLNQEVNLIHSEYTSDNAAILDVVEMLCPQMKVFELADSSVQIASFKAQGIRLEVEAIIAKIPEDLKEFCKSPFGSPLIQTVDLEPKMIWEVLKVRAMAKYDSLPEACKIEFPLIESMDYISILEAKVLAAKYKCS